MIGNLGNICLIIALALTILQAYPSFRKVKITSISILMLLIASFASLLYSHITSDFSLVNVYNNSHTAKPLIYKISGTWGNHEGSMLLLSLIIAIYGFAFCIFSKVDSDRKSIIIKIQGLVNSGFLSFIIFTSNPFDKMEVVPKNGLGLNPLLQDIGLALHPPMLYVGYVGSVICFAFAVEALIKGKIDKSWASSLKKWSLFSWSFLTFGIGLGSWWAYRELGWGGIWFWDPVENVSLIPWLSLTAFFHSLLVLEKRGFLAIWTILLAICTFAFSLMGIFLVRSGILTSVHAFANDPKRGMFILAFLGIIVFVSLLLFGLRAHRLSKKSDFGLVSKEGAILINNLLLSVSCVTVILGTLYPIFLDVLGGSNVSVGEPYFNATMPPITVGLLILAAIAPFLNWKESKLSSLKFVISIPFLAGVTCFIFLFSKTEDVISILAISVSVWLIFAMMILLWKKGEFSKYPNIKRLPLSFISMVMAHIGVGILIIGITVSSVWSVEKEEIMKHGQVMDLGGYQVISGDMYIITGGNYLAREGVFTVKNHEGDELATLLPQVRHYVAEDSNTTEASIYYSLFSNIYIAMGDSDGKGGFVVRGYYKPLINLVWLGCLIMTFAAILSLFRWKKRV